MPKDKRLARLQRKKRIRKKVFGTAERPRLTVFRSARHIYAQVVDDERGHTLAAASTLSKEIRGELAGLTKKEKAKKVGELLARICLDRGVEKVAFDRNGYAYHGRVAALAEGARQGGLKF